LSKLEDLAERGKRRLDVIHEAVENDDGDPKSNQTPDYYTYRTPTEKSHLNHS
jgi:hypothetical protein